MFLYGSMEVCSKKINIYYDGKVRSIWNSLRIVDSSDK